MAQLVKNLPAVRTAWVRSLDWEDPLEEGMITHSSILAWRIPMDRGASWATLHGVTKSWICLFREGNGTSLQYSCLENPMDGGDWWAAVHGVTKSDMTERLHFHFSLSCIGEDNGHPLQCSYLENPRDGEAWWAAVYGVAQSQTRLKRLSSSSSNRDDLKYIC